MCSHVIVIVQVHSKQILTITLSEPEHFSLPLLSLLVCQAPRGSWCSPVFTTTVRLTQTNLYSSSDQYHKLRYFPLDTVLMSPFKEIYFFTFQSYKKTLCCHNNLVKLNIILEEGIKRVSDYVTSFHTKSTAEGLKAYIQN